MLIPFFWCIILINQLIKLLCFLSFYAIRLKSSNLYPVTVRYSVISLFRDLATTVSGYFPFPWHTYREMAWLPFQKTCKIIFYCKKYNSWKIFFVSISKKKLLKTNFNPKHFVNNICFIFKVSFHNKTATLPSASWIILIISNSSSCGGLELEQWSDKRLLSASVEVQIPFGAWI